MVLEASLLNGGPQLDVLIEAPLTPNDPFFVRNHAPAPVIDPASYQLTVSGMVRRPLTLSLEALHTHFPVQRVTATL